MNHGAFLCVFDVYTLIKKKASVSVDLGHKFVSQRVSNQMDRGAFLCVFNVYTPIIDKEGSLTER